MTDYSELKRLAEAAIGSDWSGGKAYDFMVAANPAAVLALIAENEALCSKLTTVHFVCDQLPGPDGCRFIELENPQGESLGDEFGEWEIRPDGLAQLAVEIASPDVKHMAALLECVQGDLKQAMQIIEKDSKDAERYRWLRDGPDCLDFTDAESMEEVDALIDAAMSNGGHVSQSD